MGGRHRQSSGSLPARMRRPHRVVGTVGGDGGAGHQRPSRQSGGSLAARIRRPHKRSQRSLPALAWSVTSGIGRLITVLSVVVAASTVLTLAWFSLHHQQVMIVTSGSMVPEFNPGDGVTVEPPVPSKFRVGDVITFKTGPGVQSTTHRIIQLKPGPKGLFLQTKGDANKSPDPNLVPAANVSGVMTGSIPYMGFWLSFFQSKVGKVVILGTPLLLILLAQMFSMVGEVRDLLRARNRAESDEPDQLSSTAPTGPVFTGQLDEAAFSTPTLSTPTLSRPTLSARTLSARTLSTPTLSRPTLSARTLSARTLSARTLSTPTFSASTLSFPRRLPKFQATRSPFTRQLVEAVPSTLAASSPRGLPRFQASRSS